ncbi:MAG TPA: hypothetical protein PKA06_02510 [Gemmatales bacterium]|nr:hypothetical protein [Gemmatales bacterium]HMP17579.1 hypothetical protein [Gemmatales bacterium]
MKKTICLLLLAAVVGCSSKAVEAPKDTTPPAEAPKATTRASNPPVK